MPEPYDERPRQGGQDQGQGQPSGFRSAVPPQRPAPGRRPRPANGQAAPGAPGGYNPGGYNLRPAPDLTKSEEIIRVRKKRKKSSKAKKAILITVIAILCVFGLAGGAAALYLNSLSQALSFDNKQEAEDLKAVLEPVTAETKDKPFYMLLLGSDAREGDTASRSDVIILTRVDPASGKITMVSVPRDTMIDLPGHGRQKINAAYAFDGASGAVKAVSSFAGVPITHYAEIHFQELEELVDALGGVWVDVPVSNTETGASNTGMVLEAGNQLLNGEQALALARERYGYERGDFQRADNQRLIAQAIIKQVLAMPTLELPGAIQRLAECVTTDLGLGDIVDLAQKFQAAGKLTMYSGMVPSSTMTLDGVSYVITEYPAWTDMMKRVDAGYDPNDTTAVVGDTANDAAGAPAEGTTVEGGDAAAAPGDAAAANGS